MEQITVRNLGIGALLIEAWNRRILIDAFNTMIKPTEVLPGDILLFTHDDGDHFSPDQLPAVREQDILIIGPPSIVKPILLQKKAEFEQIEVLYTNNYAESASITIGNIKISCYHTNHFNHWDHYITVI